MSNEIEDLIANIQQKFDDEFSKQEEVPSPVKNAPAATSTNQPSFNPESEQKGLAANGQSKTEGQPKQEIVIEEDHENEESSVNDHQQLNKNRKLDYGEEEHGEGDNNCEGDEEQDENKYKELSHKLETALKKISSSKKQFATFHSPTGTSDYLNRFDDYQRKKEKDLEMKRKIEQEKKYHGMKAKPDINQKSKQIAEQTSYRPIYERFEHILQDKKKKMETLTESKKAHQEEEYEKFVEEYKKHAKIQPQACRDINTYFHDMMAWKSKLEKQRDEKVKQKQQKEKEGYTFKPEINKKSVRMVKNQKRVPIQEREIERPKTEQSEYTFQPKINKRRLP